MVLIYNHIIQSCNNCRRSNRILDLCNYIPINNTYYLDNKHMLNVFFNTPPQAEAYYASSLLQWLEVLLRLEKTETTGLKQQARRKWLWQGSWKASESGCGGCWEWVSLKKAQLGKERNTQTRKRSIWWSTMNADINGERNLELWPNNDYWCQNNTQQSKTTGAKILQQVGREKTFWMARFFTENFSAQRETVAGGCGCCGGRPLGQARSYKASSTVLVEAADEHQRGR